MLPPWYNRGCELDWQEMYMTEPVPHILRTDDFVPWTEKTIRSVGLIKNGERSNAPGDTLEARALLEELV
jgi:hypothetical protein